MAHVRGTQRFWPWDKDQCLRASGWFAAALVGLYGIVAVYETSSVGPTGGRVPVPAVIQWGRLLCFVALAYLATGALLGKKPYEDERSQVALGLAEMAGRTNMASIVLGAYTDPKMTLTVLNDLQVYAAEAIGTNPDYETRLREPIDKALKRPCLFAVKDEKGRSLDDERIAVLRAASRAAINLARDISSGAVPYVRVPRLPAVRVSEKGEVFPLKDSTTR